eukprot:SAG22_NODE_7231_length_759_cov_1.630303_1_plen_49_part_10
MAAAVLSLDKMPAVTARHQQQQRLDEPVQSKYMRPKTKAGKWVWCVRSA